MNVILAEVRDRKITVWTFLPSRLFLLSKYIFERYSFNVLKNCPNIFSILTLPVAVLELHIPVYELKFILYIQ
jgi:hypothetical protein